MSRYLVVGAGFAGAVYSRVLAEAGHFVSVIDKRPHVAGNAFDFEDEVGIRVHKYGPHLFHTNNEHVFRWLQQFSRWLPYEHRVRASLPDGRYVPLPVNRDTLNVVFGKQLKTEAEAAAFLESLCEPCPHPNNAADHLRSKIGTALTDIFFRPYTKKMWNLDLEDLSSAVVKRIPLRFDTDDRYFPSDRFQALPKEGYTALFTSIFDHPNIDLRLSTPFESGMEHEFEHTFNSMAIDEYFEFKFGDLPYRSIRFHTSRRAPTEIPNWGVTNYTDDGPYTRETYWQSFPGHCSNAGLETTVTIEEPCDYQDNDFERYYPVKTSDNRYSNLYERYRTLSASRSNLTFIGRCGTYQYLDMDQVINQSLQNVERFLRTRRLNSSNSVGGTPPATR
jgi:UDP-galactopyranose mutase